MRNTDRANFFAEWCASLDVRPVALWFADYQEGAAFYQNERDEVRKALLGAARGEKFDWVFTHNPDDLGEYGFHPNHREAAEVVSGLACEQLISEGMARVVHFAYQAIYGCSRVGTVARIDASYYFQLKYDELCWKSHWCGRAPDAATNLEDLGFPCPSPEAFIGGGLGLPDPFVRRQ